MKKFLLTALLSTLFISVWAQNSTTIYGSILDETGQPLPGATLQVKGTNTNTVTNLEGQYKLVTTKELPFTIQVNFVGYKTQEIEIYELIDEATDIVLQNDNILDAVVVIGYGTQKKSELTGSIASIPDHILKQPTSSLDKSLQGAVPGVQVTSTSGQPGGGVSIRIRGGSSIQGGNEPLYVIDGFPVYNQAISAGAVTGADINPLSSINPADIESIDILKDASATAIYGSRGANGVVLITTKKGKADQTNIQYDASFGVQTLRKKIDLLNAKEFAQLRNAALYDTNPGAGTNQYLSDSEIAQLGKGTDWQDEAFRAAPTQNHQLSISGGSSKTRYAVSGNYFKQDGIIRNTDFDRFSGRLNLDINATEQLTIGINASATRTNSNVSPSGIVAALLNMPPTATVYEQDGSYTLRNPFENIFSNPIASLNEQINRTQSNRILATAFAQYAITEGLTFKTSFGTDVLNSIEQNYLPSTIYEGALVKGQANVGNINSTSWLNENTLNYTKQINKHNFDVLLGFTQQTYSRDIYRAGAQDFVSDHVKFNSLQDGAIALRPYSNNSSWSLLSYLGRVNYNLDRKYYFTASLRTDGSSRFGTNNKWGYFPSAAFSWRVSQEDWFFAAKSYINDLKLRVSYGSTGNQEIGEYKSLATLTSLNYLFGGAITTGFFPTTIANKNLGWETTNQFDAGFDASFFNNRLTAGLDVYYKRTNDLLLSVEIPWSSGQSTSLQNFGSVENKGVELTLHSVNLEGDLKWNTQFNISANRNSVYSIGNGVDEYVNGNYIVKVGQPLGTFYGSIVTGVLQTGEEETKGKYTGQATPKPGDLLYKDVNGDDKYTTENDRTAIGNAQPDFIFGITNNFSWKNFDLSVFFQGVQGNEILNSNLLALNLLNGQQNAAGDAANRWTTENPSQSVPRAKVDPAPIFSSRVVEDGSFVRLKSVTLGYHIPQNLLEKIRIQQARIYVSGNNLLTWTKYTGFDPEVTNANNNVAQGTDAGIYPVARTISAGVSITF
jgi:TonB-linked SusC/RagA family outer membrane protein